MATVESALPVIDFDAFLRPISEEKPSGESLQYAGVYDEIRTARQADDASLPQGDWQSELKVADYRQVINLATSALTSQTKDLQICAWLTEALAKQYSFAGLRDGLKLVRSIEEIFWETCHPEIDEGDMEGRANAIGWIDKELSLAVKILPFTLGEGFNYNNWEESTRFNFPENAESLEYEEQEKVNAIKRQAEAENRKTGEMWRTAKAATNRAFCEQINLTLQECAEELANLDRVNEEKFDRNQVPAIRELKKSLEDIQMVVGNLLKEKQEAEPDAEDTVDESVGETTVGEDGETVTAKKMTATGAIQSRQDALKRLSDVADYFRRNEPHSPIAYLIQRAVKWGNMPLESWLQDVIKDEAVIFQIRQTLGFNTSDSAE